MRHSVIAQLVFPFVSALVLNVADVHRPDCRVPLRDNAQEITAVLEVGGQAINVIPDTGSFVAVVFSDVCKSCGIREDLLHTGTVESLGIGSHHAVQSYGSGETFSVEAWATAKMTCNSTLRTKLRSTDENKRLMFWMAEKADLSIAATSKFQGILGLGPPRSEVWVAEMDVRDAKLEMDSMSSKGFDVERLRPVLENLEDVVDLSKNVTPWLATEGVTTFSFCVGKHGRDGLLILNDQRPDQQPGVFLHINPDGEAVYWQSGLSSVQLGAVSDPAGIRTEGATKVILDSGTSLIGAPSWFVDAVVQFVAVHEPFLGCEDTSKWPELIFQLDGSELRLPGASYVGKMPDVGPEHENVLIRMPHLNSSGVCSALLFSTTVDADTAPINSEASYISAHSLQPEWILGLPFFREYYTTFRLNETTMGPLAIFLAKSDDSCNPIQPGSMEMRRDMLEPIVPPMLLDPAKLRFPYRHMRRGGRELWRRSRMIAAGSQSN